MLELSDATIVNLDITKESFNRDCNCPGYESYVRSIILILENGKAYEVLISTPNRESVYTAGYFINFLLDLLNKDILKTLTIKGFLKLIEKDINKYIDELDDLVMIKPVFIA